MKKVFKNSPSKSKQAGTAFVETALSIQFFLIVALVGLSTAMAAYRSVSLQYAAAQAVRWGVLGNRTEYPENSGTFMSRKNSIEWRLVDIASNFAIDLERNYTRGGNHPLITICPTATPNCLDGDSTESAADEREFFQVTVTYPVDLIFHSFNLTASAIGKNEPFE